MLIWKYLAPSVILKSPCYRHYTKIGRKTKQNKKTAHQQQEIEEEMTFTEFSHMPCLRKFQLLGEVGWGWWCPPVFYFCTVDLILNIVELSEQRDTVGIKL